MAVFARTTTAHRVVWPCGHIPYHFHNELNGDQRDLFRRAMDIWEDATNGCAKFVESFADATYVECRIGPSCKATVGYEQNVTRYAQCNNWSRPERSVLGDLLHEFGHVLGMKHEHQRPDRDDWVVFRDNDPGCLANEANLPLSAGVLGYMTEYDVESIMHYHECFTTSDGDPTLNYELSEKDKAGARFVYSDRFETIYAHPFGGQRREEAVTHIGGWKRQDAYHKLGELGAALPSEEQLRPFGRSIIETLNVRRGDLRVWTNRSGFVADIGAQGEVIIRALPPENRAVTIGFKL